MRRFGWIRTICVCVVATFLAITGAAPGLAVSATSMPTATVGVSRLSVSDRFALGLYRAVGAASSESGNVIVSPYSAAEALALVRGGARRRTADQLDVLLAGKNATVDPDNRAVLRAALLTEAVPGAGTYMRIANSVWVAQGYPVTPTFTALASGPYAARVDSLDFAHDSTGAAKTINDWVAGITENLIINLVTPDDFNDLTRVALVDAVLFHGKWLRQFDIARTTVEPFRVAGHKISVPTMIGTGDATVTKALTTVNLDFTGDFRMHIAMPTPSTATTSTPQTLRALDAAAVSLFTGPGQRGVREACPKLVVHLPKWETDATLDLISPLRTLGIKDLFEPGQADLTGVSPQAAGEGLYVRTVRQKATITVDEHGTVAAAATTAIAVAISAEPAFVKCPDLVRLNRPFTYVIQHVSTGEIVFVGRLMNPAA